MRLRFRLRTLLFFVLIAALASRPVANWCAARFRVDCARRIGLNDSVTWGDLIRPRDLSQFQRDGLGFGPLASDAAVDMLCSVRDVHSVVVQSSRISNDAYKSIARLKDVRRIWIRDPAHVSDESFNYLAALGQLEQLIVDGNVNVTDNCLRTIGELTSLRELVLINTSITGEGLHHLRSMKRLEKLVIYSDRLYIDDLATGVSTLPSSIRCAGIISAQKDSWPKTGLSFEIKRIDPQSLDYYLQHPDCISCEYDQETQLLELLCSSLIDLSPEAYDPFR